MRKQVVKSFTKNKWIAQMEANKSVDWELPVTVPVKEIGGERGVTVTELPIQCKGPNFRGMCINWAV